MINNQSKNRFNTKTLARIAAIQTWYSYHNNNHQDDNNNHHVVADHLEQIKKFYLDSDTAEEFAFDKDKISKFKPNSSLLNDLIGLSSDNLELIDQAISSQLSSDWTLNKLPTLLRCLLEVAFVEIKYFPETPSKVLISEYTDIASNMLSAKDVGFVNSMLENYIKTILPPKTTSKGGAK